MGPRAGLHGCGKSRPPPGFDPRTIQFFSVILIFVKIGAVKPLLCFAYDFYPLFLISDLGEIRYKTCSHNRVELLRI